MNLEESRVKVKAIMKINLSECESKQEDTTGQNTSSGQVVGTYFKVPSKLSLKAYSEYVNVVEENYTFYEYPNILLHLMLQFL